MRALLQRVTAASVKVGENIVGKIETLGWFILLGVHTDDTIVDAEYIIKKILTLRAFNDHEGKLNLSVQEVGGPILVVSQFTLYGDTSSGRRPSFITAARGDLAKKLYELFILKLREAGITVATGEFGAHMEIEITANGPVTLFLESPKP